MKIRYPAKFDADEDGRVLVIFRDLPEVATDGADIDEARREAADALTSALMFRMKYREEVPVPSRRRSDEEAVTPDAGVAMKIALYISMRAHGVTAAELTRRLGVDNREIQRILNPQHATKVARMAEAITATGSNVVVELNDADKVA
jgi:antitoxin HicB